jgi:hypothetical protein
MRTPRVLARTLLCCALMLALAPWVTATEGGASVYPAGVETVMPGLMPPPGSTLLLEFNDFYMANGLANSRGESEVPGFHLRVGAWAPKVVHNWGIRFLGGTIVSTGAIPFLYESVSAPFGIGSKTGFGNADIQPAIVTYALGPWHWWYGADLLPPGLAYTKNAFINIGQHNLAYAPSTAFTYLPHHGRLELSSKFLYFVNSTDPATNYRSGNEFLWEYDGMKKIGKHWEIGANGFWYRQMTNDLQNGLIFGDGNRGRDLAIGPEVQYHLGKYLFIAKYEKDTLVENRPIGNSFWLQFGMPVGRPHE